MTKEELLALEFLEKETPISILEKLFTLTKRKKLGGIVPTPRLFISFTSGVSKMVELISLDFSSNVNSAIFFDTSSECLVFVNLQKIESIEIEKINSVINYYPFAGKEAKLPFIGKLDLQRNLEKLKKSFSDIFLKDILLTCNLDENDNNSGFMLTECFSSIIENFNQIASQDEIFTNSIKEEINEVSIELKNDFEMVLNNKKLTISINYKNMNEFSNLRGELFYKKLESLL